MRPIQLLITALLVLTLPVTGVHAAIPEIPVFDNPNGYYVNPVLRPFDFSKLDLRPLTASDVVPTALGARIAEIFSDPAHLATDNEQLLQLTAEELEFAIQEELIIEQEDKFWDRRKLVAGLGILFSIGLLVGLIAMLSGSGAGGSGAGSGGGSGSGSGGGEGLPPNDPNGPGGDDGGGGGLLPGGGGGAGGGGGEGGGGGFIGGGGNLPGGNFPSGIPHNPEPSTLILLGLGLALPYFRKKR